MFRHLSPVRLLLTYPINRYQMTPTCPISTINRHPLTFVSSTCPERPEHSFHHSSDRPVISSFSSHRRHCLFVMVLSFLPRVIHLHCKSNKTFSILLCMIMVMVHYRFCCSIYASRRFALRLVSRDQYATPNTVPIRVRLYFNNSIKINPHDNAMTPPMDRVTSSLYLSDA